MITFKQWENIPKLKKNPFTCETDENDYFEHKAQQFHLNEHDDDDMEKNIINFKYESIRQNNFPQKIMKREITFP